MTLDPEPDPCVRAGCRALRPDLPWEISGTEMRAMDYMARMSMATAMANTRERVRAVLAAAEAIRRVPV